MVIYLDDKSGVRFYSNGRAVIDGTTVNVGKPQKVLADGYTVDAFLSGSPERRNSEYNRIGYCLVPKLGGGEVLYSLLEKTNATKEDLHSKTFGRNSGIKLQSYYFVRNTDGNICAIRGKSGNNSVIATQSGERVPVKDYYFFFSGKAESVKNRGTFFSSWKLTPIEKKEDKVAGDKTYNGGGLPEITAIAQVPGMPSNFSKNTDNVKILQQYLVRMGEQKNIATRKVPSGVDGMFGYRTAAVTAKVMRSQKWTWDQLWANAVKYAQQTNGQSSPVSNGAVQSASNQLNPEAAEFANPQKLTAKTQGITLQAQPASTAQYAANASNVLQPKQSVAESVENKDKETVEEIKNTFYDIFNRMNNATILQ